MSDHRFYRLSILLKSQFFWCVVGIFACLAWTQHMKLPARPDAADAEQYIGAAYNLAYHNTFNEQIRDDGTSPSPGIGREPGYPLFLSVLFRLDGHSQEIKAACLQNKGCPTSAYYSAQWANRILIALTGLVVFFTLKRLTNSSFAAIFSGMHIWLNHQMHKGHAYVTSDDLAMFLVSLLLFAICWAWPKKNPLVWIIPGLALAALALTKAIFFYFIPPAILFGLIVVAFAKHRRLRILASLAIFVISAGIPITTWMARNEAVNGQFKLTDDRGAIALSTRVVFNDMNWQEYLASLVYWTRGSGDNWAKAIFPKDVIKPFAWYDPDGYYLRGQLAVPKRIDSLMKEQSLTHQQAYKIAEHEVIDRILEHPIKHIVTTLPLFYRGIWIDELAVITIPAFFILLFGALRRRNGLLIAVLLPPLFSLMFYAAFSLNIPRYQMTAMPGLAIAFGYFVLWLRRQIVKRRDKSSTAASPRTEITQ
jgi:4-amino-4-deoxy-L-arabinose transferase-like glycosyltransferase